MRSNRLGMLWSLLGLLASLEQNVKRSLMRLRGRSSSGEVVTPAEIAWGYRLLLGREPEGPAAIRAHSVAGLDVLRKKLLASLEFGQGHAEFLSQLPSSINFSAEWGQSTLSYYEAIERSGVSLDRIATMYADSHLADEYGRYHLRRFHELFGYLSARCGRSAGGVELLEVGTSAHTTPFFSDLLPCQFDTICRPVELGGPDQAWAQRVGGRRHWQIDLNQPQRCAEWEAQTSEVRYDAIICCEVVEHLVRAPREIIRLLVNKLKPGGFLYLTTPNALTPWKISRLFAGVNPFPGFEDYNNNLNAHQHFREYTPLELLDEIRLAGAVAGEVALSNCWDHPRYVRQDEVMFRSNIVIIAVPGAFPGDGAAP